MSTSPADQLSHAFGAAYHELIAARRGKRGMCRNIRTLFNFEPPVTDEEIRAASIQFVRKISGFTKPSKANEAAFLSAVDEIARISGQLLASLESTAAPRIREEEAAKAKLRAKQRFGGESTSSRSNKPGTT